MEPSDHGQNAMRPSWRPGRRQASPKSKTILSLRPEDQSGVLHKQDIQFIKENIAPRSAPILSMYLNVNPAEPTNANRAWLVRVKDSLKGLDVPREVREKVMRELEVTRPAARIYVVFAAEDLMQ